MYGDTSCSFGDDIDQFYESGEVQKWKFPFYIAKCDFCEKMGFLFCLGHSTINKPFSSRSYKAPSLRERVHENTAFYFDFMSQNYAKMLWKHRAKKFSKITF